MPLHDFSSGGDEGREIGYDQVTAGANITSTTEATGTTVIACAAHYFDGSPVLLQVFIPDVRTPTGAAGDQAIISLFESSTQIGRIALCKTPSATSLMIWTVNAFYRFTPTPGNHTYTVTAHVNVTTGTPQFNCGSGGTGTDVPAFARFTKA